MATAVHRIVQATAVAGTLDILAAVGLTLAYGRTPAAMLRYVASGPFPAAKDWGAGGSMLGLGVHYALMAIMAALYVLAADRTATLKSHPLPWGIAYGLATFVVMNLMVVPMRFGTTPGAVSIVSQLFCHVVLVGLPTAYIARR